MNYPELKVLAEAGEIGVTVKTEDEAIRSILRSENRLGRTAYIPETS